MRIYKLIECWSWSNLSDALVLSFSCVDLGCNFRPCLDEVDLDFSSDLYSSCLVSGNESSTPVCEIDIFMFFSGE